MQHKKNLSIHSANHSRKSSISSQGSAKGSDGPNTKFNGCYIQISPRFDALKGLAFQNQIKDVKITSPTHEQLECISPQPEKVSSIRKSLLGAKEDSLKKSQFSKNVHTVDELK